MDTIKSLKDDRIQLARSLNSLKGRLQHKKFLLESTEAILWANNTNIKIDFVFISDKIAVPEALPKNIKIYKISEGLLKKVTDTKYVLPVVGIGNFPELQRNSQFQIVLDNLQDFGNIGTIVRTCHAFGIQNLISTNSKIDLFHKKTVDASRGKVFSTDLQTFENPTETIKHLKNQGYQIITTSPYGENIQSMTILKNKPVALIIGNETNGVSDEFMKNADFTVQIPMSGEVESLNVGVATGISIYELKLKQVIAMIEKKIKSTLGREINVAAMLIQKSLDKELKKVSEFSSKQIVFMMVLKCDETMKIIDIQKQFGLPDGELEGFINPLVNKKYILKNSENEVAISEIGVDVLGKLWAIIENTEAKILSDFSEEEKQELLRLVNKLKNNCIKIIDD